MNKDVKKILAESIDAMAEAASEEKAAFDQVKALRTLWVEAAYNSRHAKSTRIDVDAKSYIETTAYIRLKDAMCEWEKACAMYKREEISWVKALKDAREADAWAKL